MTPPAVSSAAVLSRFHLILSQEEHMQGNPLTKTGEPGKSGQSDKCALRDQPTLVSKLNPYVTVLSPVQLLSLGQCSITWQNSRHI